MYIPSKKEKENLCTLEYTLYIYTCQYGMGVEGFTLLVIENVDRQVKHGLFHYKDVLGFNLPKQFLFVSKDFLELHSLHTMSTFSY